MSIEVGKLIQVYEQCINMLTAKGELFISEIPNTPQLPQNRPTNQDALFEACPIFISNSVQLLLKGWSNMYSMFKDFKYGNDHCINHLKTKMNSLKNNTDLLTKEEQLISQMESDIKGWNQLKDPLIYYDLKRKNTLLEQLEKKRKLIQDASAITKQSAAPLYLRKVEQQFKALIYSVYMDSNLIDNKAKQRSASQWELTKSKVYREGKHLGNLNLIKYIVLEKNQFCQKFFDLFSKKVRFSQYIFTEYYQSLHALIKNIKGFWKSYLKSLNILINQVSQYKRIFQLNKDNMEKRQINVIKHLEKTSQTISVIFRIQSSLNLLASLNQIFQIIPSLNKFLTCLTTNREIIQSSIKSCDDYLAKISSQISARQKQFNSFYIEDKNFLDYHCKNQNVVDKKLYQGYLDFLNICYNISGDNQLKFIQKSSQIYEPHQIGSLLTKQIMTNASPMKNSILTQSQYSGSTGSDGAANNKDKKNQKLIKIQHFIQKMQVFDSSSINWNSNNVHSCALGPKLLLHGKIVILQQGIYFESLFNKKNLFFGRTKLFVPKQQILDVNIENTLVIFPDAIMIKTKVGPLYFHSLGSRKTINSILNQVYFPQNNQNQNDCVSQTSFNECPQNETQKFTSAQIADLLKPCQVFFVEKVFKNTKLNKFFKRYYSDDKFQIKGQTYENFKIYFMTQIDAIQPKSTQLVPEAPYYFNYKNEQNSSKNLPKISERYTTYRKAIPKIPFLSSGGQGNCEDKAIYSWISPKILVVNSISKVNGFSLTEGMQIYLKAVCKEQGSDVKINLSAEIKFTKQASSNGLVKGPGLSNLKDSVFKMVDIMQKYEKGKKGRGKKNSQMKGNQQNQELQQKIAQLQNQNRILKKKIKIGLISFLILYIFTIIGCKMLFS